MAVFASVGPCQDEAHPPVAGEVMRHHLEPVAQSVGDDIVPKVSVRAGLCAKAILILLQQLHLHGHNGS